MSSRTYVREYEEQSCFVGPDFDNDEERQRLEVNQPEPPPVIDSVIL